MINNDTIKLPIYCRNISFFGMAIQGFRALLFSTEGLIDNSLPPKERYFGEQADGILLDNILK